jgi:hypothetical protein
VRLSAPRNWTVSGQPAPLVVTLESGTAVVALWRYPSAAPAPSGPAGLAQARQALLAAVRRRDPQVKLLGSSFSTVSGAAAIQVQAREQIAGRTRRVSSTHVYVRGAELVLDEYAPPAQFATVDRAVFVPVRQSLTLLPTGGA